MIRRIKELAAEDKGAAMVLVGVMITVLLGMAAFGTDLAWFYLNSSRVQRGADAAALAGVVWMPADPATAVATAQTAAVQNGYNAADAETTVTAGGVPGEPHQLAVTISHDVPTFFLRVFGMDSMTIAQKATAEFVPPLRLGSPFGTMGNDPNCFNPPSASNPCSGNYWIGIYGTHINTRNGDAFSSFCNGGAPDDDCTPNPMYRPEGYLFGVIPSTNLLTVESIDPNHRYHGDPQSSKYGDRQRTGDNLMSDNDELGPTTYFTLWDSDPTPTNLADNGAPLCNATFDSIPQIDPDQDPPFNPPDPSWIWETVCSNIPVTPGETYVLQVRVEGLGGDDDGDDGSNRFSLRGSNPADRLFGIRDFSVFYNSNLATSYMYLAEVPSIYAGKTLVIEGFDPGDVGEQGFLSLMEPTGAGTWQVFSSCEKFVSTTTNAPTYVGSVTETPCTFIADNRGSAPPEHNFQNKWFKLEVHIPPGYSCSTNCWWQIEYAFSSAPSDHVTWRASVLGNPIHLVP